MICSWNDRELTGLFKKNTPLIDVRAPIEFNEGVIPGSINLPIMNDEERKLVGICYKNEGQSAAIELGHTIVSADLKEERINKWCSFIEKNPETEIFCFRGGLRSQITCQWINEKGFHKKPISGGYKRIRRFFLSWINDAPLRPFIRIGGLTGSGKTHLLHKIQGHLDLEKFANHRGSAFGGNGIQPSQITFENLIALNFLKSKTDTIIVEDESVMLGKLTVPQRIIDAMRNSPLIILENDIEKRIHNIFIEYVKESKADFFIQNLSRIQKKMGKSKISILQEEIIRAFERPMELSSHRDWIATLLQEYYDPLYQKGLRFNQDKIIFKGNATEILDFLSRHNICTSHH